jgi:hypothetical protein
MAIDRNAVTDGLYEHKPQFSNQEPGCQYTAIGQLIKDFIPAIEAHRRVWHIDSARRCFTSFGRFDSMPNQLWSLAPQIAKCQATGMDESFVLFGAGDLTRIAREKATPGPMQIRPNVQMRPAC